MNHETITEEYLRELTLRGMRTKNVKYSLSLFFEYIKNMGINFLRLKLRDAEDFQMYLTTKTKEDGTIHYSKGSILAVMGTLTSFYNYLKKRDYIYSNPFMEAKKVKTGKSLPKNILNEADMNRFLNHLKDFRKGKNLFERRKLYKAHVISELLYSTGARINELAGLKDTDVDYYRGVINITDNKGLKRREVILNSFTEKVLRLYTYDMREYVLFGKNNADKELLFGTRVNLKTWLNTILNRESERLGFGKFTSHNFRHAVGYHLLRGGCDIRYIQEILGHKALSTTQVYTKVDKEDLKSVIDEYHPRRFKEHEKP